MKIFTRTAQSSAVSGQIGFLTTDTNELAGQSFTDRHQSLGTVTTRDNLILVGIGKKEKVTLETLRNAAGQAAREANKEQWTQAEIFLPNLFSPQEEANAITEGALLGTYEFDRYKAKKKTQTLQELILLTSENVTQSIKKGEVYANATILARDLANEPPNLLRPSTLAEFVVSHFEHTDAEVKVYAGDQLIEEQMVGVLTVGKGSVNKPRFLEIHYVSDPTKPLIALVGKGITFDTGGISLKSGRDISDMRLDMAGAAAVIGAIDALVAAKVDCNVIGFIAAAENIPDAGSMLPGELIQYPNGVSVQVANTDAEGRLVLADALIRAMNRNAVFTVDIATLTGAAAAALGTKYAAVFGTDPLVATLQEAGANTGDELWRMPLVEEYNEQLRSNYADLSNIGKGKGGAITAALFLQHFVKPEAKWAHIDMAGPMEAESTSGYRPAGATGFGVRVLAEAVQQLTNM
ncbi:leucyl aminopeptidase family protein [Sulfoacidibacillus thermotolerans]|uniref:Probable cytosol aminopeptidase n=1 Tax=Sulfoacidibacillus thermotolerans TaxID=1765684 RepID=A0A2U3DCM7_SULT2|nr:leucyl aminopeptidase family protein [Sulfoacidibacillus thermotolerans]PWI59040.1 hypothetical protein BM613_00030 [Sulfoacidibacillus thermotolerans]